MSLGTICSLCPKLSGRFEPQKFNPKPRPIEISKNQKLCDISIFCNTHVFLAQAEFTKYLICPNLDVTPNGRSKLSRTDNKKGLLIQDSINKSIDVDNNPHLVL